MKAIRPRQVGGPEVLTLEDYATPSPGAGEVLVRVEAAGVNYMDTYQRSGLYKAPLPIALGAEGAGTIEAMGQNTSGLRTGDRVAWTGVAGSYATHVVVPADRAVPIPPNIETKLAAAVLLQGLTAHYLSHSTFPLSKGHDALVHAAAGGVGLLLVQMAKRAGARVIGTVSTRDKAELARRVGADEIILYTEEDFEHAARARTDGRGVHVVYDSVGRTTFDQSMRSLAPRGYLVLFGQSSGPVPPFEPQLLVRGSLFLTRPTLADYTRTREELLSRSQQVFDWVSGGELQVRIDRTFPLARAGDAHRALESRETTGKLLLVP